MEPNEPLEAAPPDKEGVGTETKDNVEGDFTE